MTTSSTPAASSPRRRGRPPLLNPERQQLLCKLLAEGLSLDRAARFVGCSLLTITRRERNDPDFRLRLREAMGQAQLHYLDLLRRGAERDWRAAAWFLERSNPEHYARYKRPRRPSQRPASPAGRGGHGVVPHAMVETVLSEVATLISTIEDADSRHRVNERVADLYAQTLARTPGMRRRWSAHQKRG